MDLPQEGEDGGRPLHICLVFLVVAPPLVGPHFRHGHADQRQEQDDEGRAQQAQPVPSCVGRLELGYGLLLIDRGKGRLARINRSRWDTHCA